MKLDDVCELNTTQNEPNIMKPGGTNKYKPSTLSLPIRALKKLQDQTRAVQFEFFERIYELETEFQKKHELFYKRRCEIIKGDYVPTEAESNIYESLDAENTEERIVSETNDPSLPSISGVPLFWLHVLSSAFREIHDNDRPILEYLTDIRVTNKPFSERGFVLEFEFSSNEYFENALLTKEYFYTCSDNKMVNEFPVIRKSVGCEIKWKEGKAPTYPSWFEFLVSSKTLYDSEGEIMSYMSDIQKDFEMGYFFKEHVIPKAVLYVTGEKTDVFFVPYPEFWSDSSSGSPTDNDTISSELEDKNELKDHPKNETKDELADK